MALTSGLSQQIRAEVDCAQRVLLHFHPNPDGDSIGSALGMAHALRAMGKDVTVIQGDSEILPGFRELPGCDSVVPQSYVNIDTSKFDLFLVLDVSNLEKISNQGEVIFPDTMRTVVIDHHMSNRRFGDVNWVEPEYPATALMIHELLSDWQVPLSHDAALCLLIGIHTDTGGFSYDATTPQSFSAAAQLATIAPDYTNALFILKNSKEKAAMSYKGLALSHLEEHCDGHFVMSVVSAQMLQENNLEPRHAEKSEIAQELRSVVGWDVSAGLLEFEPGTVSVSLRTRDSERFPLGTIADSLGGGGHAAAAGLTLKMPLEEAKYTLIQAIQPYFESK